ncbi:MAG: hypothetical protein NC299_11685 [Lachnospiraceae bacterium]|nr:hypothetical protein [Ruminococcus sp.]MCM1276003.1 hypothetical protein [Lachnospiraceae bacterium]
MVCVNCGKNLIRGYAFCLECGSPVPPEVLEEGGMPGRTDNEGRPSEPKAEGASEANDDTEKPVSEVQSSMPGIEPLDGGGSGETLVFCPNCGMHMQKDPYRCDKCGMILGDRPKNIPTSAGGVPLMNPDETAVGGGLGLGLDGVSESEIEQISSFMSGSGDIPIFAAEDNSNPDLFGNGISANDMAALSEQLANFSAANQMPSIEAIEPKAKKSVPEVDARRVDNFSMSDDGAAAAVTDNAVPVVGDYSMDEDSNEHIDIDPYKFLDNSMDDAPLEMTEAPKAPEPVKPRQPEVPKPEQVQPEPVFGGAPSVPSVGTAPVENPEKREEPVELQKTAKEPEKPPVPEKAADAPVIEESAPVISEYVSAPNTQQNNSDSIFNQPAPQPARQAAPQAPLGTMFRCRLCGQCMYDTDKFCPNCGAPYKKAAAKKKPKALIIVLIVVLLVLAVGAGIYFALSFLSNGIGSVFLPPALSAAPSSGDVSALTAGLPFI